MNVVIAPDAFKDCLSASEVAEAMKNGVLAFDNSAQCHVIKASDGGEGFLNAVASYISEVKQVTVPTVDPLGRNMSAAYLYDTSANTAYVELARASGLELLSDSERNPMFTSTYGTGLQIKHAVEQGATTVYLGIGGSATNDAGTGIAHALGYEFFDANDSEVKPMGSTLETIDRIGKPNSNFEHVNFYAVNDVLNPLFGPSGAAHTYARQKGAGEQEIRQLNSGLEHLANVVKEQLNVDEANTPGSGAAGGTAFGLKSFFNAVYISGASFILGLSGFESLLLKEKIDVIFTGEGMIDHQTAFGKFVFGIAQEANRLDIPVLGICGKLNVNDSELKKIGLRMASEIYDPTKPPGYSYTHATTLIKARTMDLLEKLVRQ